MPSQTPISGLNGQRIQPTTNDKTALYSTVKRNYTISSSHDKDSTATFVVTKNCWLAVTSLLVCTIVISVVAMTIALLYSVGILTSPTQDKEFEAVVSQLKTNVTSLIDKKIKMQNESYDAKIKQLLESLYKMALSNNEIKTSQIQLALQSLPQDQLASILNNLTDSSLSRCQTESYAVGLSPKQDVAYSGEFQAEQVKTM